MNDRPIDHTGSINDTPVVPPVLEGQDILELGNNVDFSNFQVVRGEYYADIRNPFLTIYKYKVYVNMACLRLFPDTEYVFILVDKESKLLIIRPCDPFARDSYRWKKESKGKWVPRQGLCKRLFALIMNLMRWNPDNRYRLLGSVAHGNDEYVLLFDLNSFKCYTQVQRDGEKPKMSRTGFFQEDWSGEFGLPYYEHQRYTQINVQNGFMIIAENPSPRQATITGTLQGESEDEHTESRDQFDDRHEEEPDTSAQTNTDVDRDAEVYTSFGRSDKQDYSGAGNGADQETGFKADHFSAE